MRKSIYLIGACALVAAATVVWSQNAPVSSRANTGSAAAEAATPPAMSPTEMTINRNRPLPVERWDAF